MLFRDPVSAGSHWLMGIFSLTFTLFLFRFSRQNPRRCMLVGIFGICTTILYSVSGLFHTLNVDRETLKILQKLDMSAIYLMIAGSCTPIAGILLRGWFRTMLLAGEWLFAATGIATLWIFAKPVHPVMVGLYLGMGWLGCLGIWHYWKATGWKGFSWAMAGAGWYTFGAICELTHWPIIWPEVIESHEVMHLCDIAGTICHLVFIIKYVLPFRRKSS